MNYHHNLGLKKAELATGLGTKILSSGIYVPKERVTSDEIYDYFESDKRYGIPKTWMSENMGILERRMSPDDALPSDLAIAACRGALKKVSPDEIDAVIFCGIERDQAEPATAHTIQKKLGLNAKYAFDIANACYGFFDGLRVASSLIQSHAARKVLVTTGEVPTKLTRQLMERLKKGITEKELKNQMGFLSVGDAGGAVVVGESGDGGLTGFRSFEGRTLSQYNELCHYKHNNKGELECEMQMAKIVARTIRLGDEMIREAQRSKQWRKPKFFMTHQVGKKAFQQLAKWNIVAEDRMIKSYDYYGNVTSATFSLNYHQLMNDDRLMDGDEICSFYTGSGIVAGLTTFKH